MGDHPEIFSNLPEQHLPALETFQILCGEEGLLDRPAGLSENDEQYGLNDETSILRYLRAGRFDPHRSLKQFQQARKTHVDNRILSRYNEIDVSEFEAARLLSRAAEMGKGTSVTATQRASIAHDYLTRFAFPLCTAMKDRPRPDVPITGAVYLVDIRNITMKQVWDVKNYTTDIAQLLMTGYPEILGRVFILNAPSYFGWMWSIMKKWIDPGTVAKLVFVPPKETMSTLTKYIDPKNIPIRFGGEFAWEQGTPLDLDINIQYGLEWKEEERFPAGPMKWVLDESGRKTAVAVGSVDGVPRTTMIAQVKVEEKPTRVEYPEKTIGITDVKKMVDDGYSHTQAAI
ncbi:SEC14 cytosolic factor [Penicillium malachiteum]|nr:SEC14 cytosolic factor [Penicillium malachiteum]